MPYRIILAIIILTLIVLPITGSSGIPGIPFRNNETTETAFHIHEEANTTLTEESAAPAPEEQPDTTVPGVSAITGRITVSTG